MAFRSRVSGGARAFGGRCTNAAISYRRLKALEAERKPVAIGEVLGSAWEADLPAIQLLQGFEHWAIALVEQPIGHMEPIVWVDADQIRIECRVMNFR